MPRGWRRCSPTCPTPAPRRSTSPPPSLRTGRRRLCRALRPARHPGQHRGFSPDAAHADDDRRGLGHRSRGEPQRAVLPVPGRAAPSAGDRGQHRQRLVDRRRRGRGVLGRLLRGQARAGRHDPGAAIEFTKEKLRVNAVCPGGMPTAQTTEFQAPDNADWDLIMRIASPRGFMQTEDVAKASHSWPVTTPRRSTGPCTGWTTARAPADRARPGWTPVLIRARSGVYATGNRTLISSDLSV